MGFKAVFQTVAPFLATTAQMAAPGPLGNMAAAILSKAGGKSVAPSQLQEAITNLAQTPEGLQKLKEMENEFQLRCKELQIESAEKLQQMDEEDRASARQREVELAKAGAKDNTPKALAALVCVLAVIIIGMVFSGKAHSVLVEPATAGLAGAIVGYVFRDLGQVIGYYFGSSSGSDRKTELLAEAPPVQK